MISIKKNSSLDKIKIPVTDELELFQERFKNEMHSNVPLLDRITYYIVKRKGKQIRPLFVFLTAKVCGKISEETYTAASLIELLHTATLVHDDVVDESNLRRGFFSINALWKNKVAVLVGDFLFSKGMLLALEKESYNLFKIVSIAVKSMSEGELMQMEKSRKLNHTEEDYYKIIRQKTASLLAASCEAGASSVTKDPTAAKKMHEFGEHVGVAFQIKDDLLDYGSDSIGKPLAIDIKEKKLTLPLIYTLKQLDKKTQRHWKKFLKKDKKDQSKIAELISLVNETGGIQYAQEKMIEYKNKALAILDEFEESQAKQSLIQLLDFVIDRTN